MTGVQTCALPISARITYIIDEKGVISEVIEKVDTKNHAEQILGESASTAKAPVKTKKIAAKKVVKAAKKVVKKIATKQSAKKTKTKKK